MKILPNVLYIIPARGGSKGVSKKNIKKLNGKPLIHYTLEVAVKLISEENICVSTDSEEIIDCVEKFGLKVPFVRPDYLAQDEVGNKEVMLHAIDFYKKKGIDYDTVVYLQPPCPFRTVNHVKEALALYKNDVNAVLSVKETKSNPYYLLYEDNKEGFLEKSKKYHKVITRRQDCPPVYELNGSIFIVRTNILKQENMTIYNMPNTKKYVMDSHYSIDIDDILDWELCEAMLKKQVIKIG